ncbi:MAG: nicotinate (nicotinamide) nucleotide adenylyltransferase [Moraxella sp.]|uniref:nicotinate (nicotinamide) nucleotide adenylyltransferase n=1 Tax=Moraxella sp. TaxID=479 RepID=UPI0026DD66C5|nr:nicotinate (nicotinamide) nucleotide adenylyltransferase [Moraxella sp.]MDO4451105.1 nicotinate (nicotinamide) nucleotide adenylyltransferase [Moraxella sp.]
MIRVFFGGSFDPVHEGHLDIMRHIYHALSAQHTTFELSFLPTAGNPFKGNPTDPTHRLAMLDVACKILKSENIFAQICPLEIHQTPPVYTIDTVKLLNKQHPDDTLIFVMGGDSLSSLHRWKAYDELLKLVQIWAVARADNDVPIDEKVLPHITHDFGGFLDGQFPIFYDRTPIVAISSSQIRTSLANDEHPPHLPLSILNYIKNHQLYRAC